MDGSEVRMFRRMHGLSIAAMSKLCTLQKCRYAAFERGELEFSYDELLRIQNVMDRLGPEPKFLEHQVPEPKLRGKSFHANRREFLRSQSRGVMR